MTSLRHIVEPERLLLTWQPPDEGAPNRTRRVVAELVPFNDRSGVTFRYLRNGADFEKAHQLGFRGFPAFKIDSSEVREGVLDAFLRRLPPRKREDFGEFLSQHWLPSPFPGSDLALLGYTGAKLPSDGFSLVPCFSPAALPCEYVMEVAGTRHFDTNMTSISVGDSLELVLEAGNPVDPDALAVHHNGRQIGYVNRAMRPTFFGWLEAGNVSLSVAKKNGKPSRPLIYARVSVEA